MAQQAPVLRTNPPRRKRAPNTVYMEDKLEEEIQRKPKPKLVVQRPPGWEPEKILGSCGDPEGNSYFVCKIKNSDIAEIIPHDEIKENYPLLVCKFYEERMIWSTTDDE